MKSDGEGASAYVWSITFNGHALGDIPLLQSGNGTCGASGGSECWLTTESGESGEMKGYVII